MAYGAGRSGTPAHIHPFVSLADCELVEPIAAARGVAKWARGDPSVEHVDEGFMAAYRKAAGRPDRLPGYWLHKREEFITRHMKQVQMRSEPLYKPDGSLTNRHIALIMWAYSPDSEKP
jgi:hypothetical protein